MSNGETYLLIKRVEDGQLRTEIHWNFEDPHDAGHVIGQLIRTVVRAFESQNPGTKRLDIAELIFEGVACSMGDAFFEGDDSDRVTEH